MTTASWSNRVRPAILDPLALPGRKGRKVNVVYKVCLAWTALTVLTVPWVLWVLSDPAGRRAERANPDLHTDANGRFDASE